MFITDLLICFWLGAISWQDYKYRAVSWFLFPMGFILFSFKSMQYGSVAGQFEFFFINCCICLFVFFCLMVYFSIKDKKIVNIVDKYLGTGDLLFFIIISLAFSPVNFVLFINLSLFFILFFYMAATGIVKLNSKRVPFAGIMSFIYLVFFTINNFHFKINPYIDINILDLP